MTAEIQSLPIWKKDSSPGEWLQECAARALEHPERFARIVLIAEEHNERVHYTRWWQRNYQTNTDVMGSIELAKLEIFEYMRGRRK